MSPTAYPIISPTPVKMGSPTDLNKMYYTPSTATHLPSFPSFPSAQSLNEGRSITTIPSLQRLPSQY